MIIVKFFRIMFFFCGVSLFLMYLFSAASGGPQAPDGTLFLCMVYGVLGFLCLQFEKKRINKKIKSKKIFLNEVESIATKHMKQLAREKIKNIHEDVYGNIVLNQWYSHDIPYFIENVLKKEIKIPFRYLNDVIDLVDEISNNGIDEYYRKSEKKKNYRKIKSLGSLQNKHSSHHSCGKSCDYDKVCTGILNNNGWIVFLTKHDDGVSDIIAEKDEVAVLIKCKKDLSLIDEEVVQNACSDKDEYVADHSAVVSELEYSEADRELALTKGVFLLHHNDLGQLEELF